MKKMKIVVTSSANEHEWKGYGMKLKIPSESLPANISSCTITVMVSLSGQYQFPEDTELVSPVFWLRCEPKCKFVKPLSLEIQHCALPENSHRLFMVRAVCTQKELPYSFKVLHGATFSKHSSYGIIELDSFSGAGVVQEKGKKRKNWSSVFYMGPPSNRDIHFAVTWHSDAHITVSRKKGIDTCHNFKLLQTMREHYSKRKASQGPEQRLIIKKDALTLDLPKNGIDKDGWKVTPNTSLTVSFLGNYRLSSASKISFRSQRRRLMTTIQMLQQCHTVRCWLCG